MSRFVLLIFFNVSLARFNESSPARYGASPTITIDSGALVGRAKSDQKGELPINIYLGVPFAASPVRFEPPSKPRPWKKTFDASDYGPACMQQFPYQLSPSRDQVISWFNTPPPPAGESEDCLNVNVWSPAMPGKKAVMFWIYGGSLQFGANSVPNYDGSFIPANQSVVVVSVNYRTNVFGFPASPQLETEGQNLG